MSGKADFVRANKPLTAFSAVVAIALALGGCNDIAAQHAAPLRPVLVTSVHYEAQALQRSFVGTVRPRIEADMGFRVGGKVSKRLVEVGAMVDGGQLPRSTKSISSCKPSRPTRNSVQRPACWRKRAPPKRAPRSSGRRGGRPTPNWTRRKRPPMRPALDSNAPNDRSN